MQYCIEKSQGENKFGIERLSSSICSNYKFFPYHLSFIGEDTKKIKCVSSGIVYIL